MRSETAGKRVFESISKFIEEQLKLRVNKSKSAVDRPSKRKLLGFSFTPKDKRRKVAPKAIERFKDKVRRITSRTGGKNIIQVIQQLKLFMTGWKGYFGFSEVKRSFKELDSWIQRRLRCLIWKQWRTSSKRYRELRKRKVNIHTAWVTVKSGKGPWRLSNSPAVQQALDNRLFQRLELPKLFVISS